MQKRFEITLVSLTVVVVALPVIMLAVLLAGRFAEQHRVIAMEIKATDLVYLRSYSQALAILEEAKDLAKEASPSQLARISMGMAEIAVKKKDFELAISSYKTAQATYDELRQKTRPESYSSTAASNQLFFVRDGFLSFLIAGRDHNKAIKTLSRQIVEVKSARQKHMDDGVLDFIGLQWMGDLAKVNENAGRPLEGRIIRAARSHQIRNDLNDNAMLERAPIEDRDVARAVLSLANQAFIDGDRKKAVRLAQRLYPVLNKKMLPELEVQIFAERYYSEIKKLPPLEGLEMLASGEPILDYLPSVYKSFMAVLYADFAYLAQENGRLELADDLRLKACLEAESVSNKKELTGCFDKLLAGFDYFRAKYSQDKRVKLELVRRGLSLAEQANSISAVSFASFLVNEDIISNDPHLSADVDKLIALLKQWKGKISSAQMQNCIWKAWRLGEHKDLHRKLLETIEVCLDPKDPAYPWELARCAYLLGPLPGHSAETEMPAFKKAAALLLNPSCSCPPALKLSADIHVAQYYLYFEPKTGYELAKRAMTLMDRMPPRSQDERKENATSLQMLFDSAANNAAFWNDSSYYPFMDKLASLCVRTREEAYGRRSLEYASTLAALAAYKVRRGDLATAGSLNQEALTTFAALNARGHCFYDLAKKTDGELKATHRP